MTERAHAFIREKNSRFVLKMSGTPQLAPS
jgi:hypothetical protein